VEWDSYTDFIEIISSYVLCKLSIYNCGMTGIINIDYVPHDMGTN